MDDHRFTDQTRQARFIFEINPCGCYFLRTSSTSTSIPMFTINMDWDSYRDQKVGVPVISTTALSHWGVPELRFIFVTLIGCKSRLFWMIYIVCSKRYDY